MTPQRKTRQVGPSHPCPDCGADDWTGCEYQGGTPESYDGVSEWHCNRCGARFGRWSGRTLIAGDIEKRYGRA